MAAATALADFAPADMATNDALDVVADDEFRSLFPDEEYSLVSNVPLIDEHQPGPDADGNPRPYIGREELAAVVEANNRRVSDTGDYVPLIIGHTPSEADALRGAAIPPVVGYAGPFRLQKIGRVQPRWAIVADKIAVMKQYAAQVNANPRRSVELWFNRKTGKPVMFDPIALLGATTPERSLGLMRLSAVTANNPDLVCVRYEMDNKAKEKSGDAKAGQGEGNSPTDQKTNSTTSDTNKADEAKKAAEGLRGDEAIVAKLFAALEKSDVFVWAREQMAAGAAKAQIEEESERREAMVKAQQEEAGLNPNGNGDPNQNPTGDKPPPGNPESDDMATNDANAAKAAADKEAADKAEKENYAKAAKERDEYRENYQKATGELAAVKEQLASVNERLVAIEKEKVTVERYSKLSQMEHEGYVFAAGIDEEKKIVADMTDAECERYMKSLERNCRKIPMGHTLPEGVERETYAKGSKADAERATKRAEVEKLALTKKGSPEERFRQAAAELNYTPTA